MYCEVSSIGNGCTEACENESIFVLIDATAMKSMEDAQRKKELRSVEKRSSKSSYSYASRATCQENGRVRVSKS